MLSSRTVLPVRHDQLAAHREDARKEIDVKLEGGRLRWPTCGHLATPEKVYGSSAEQMREQKIAMANAKLASAGKPPAKR
jgi:hypothetical protein